MKRSIGFFGHAVRWTSGGGSRRGAAKAQCFRLRFTELFGPGSRLSGGGDGDAPTATTRTIIVSMQLKRIVLWRVRMDGKLRARPNNRKSTVFGERAGWQRCSSVLRFWFRLWIGRISALFWVAKLGACLGLVFLLQSRSAPAPLVTHVDGTNKTLTAQLRIQAAGGVTNLSDVLVRGIDVAWEAPETKASKEEPKADGDAFEKVLGLLDGMVPQVGTLPGTLLGFVGILVAISRLVSRVRAFGFDPVVVFRPLREGGALPSMEAKNSLQLKFAPKFQEVTPANPRLFLSSQARVRLPHLTCGSSVSNSSYGYSVALAVEVHFKAREPGEFNFLSTTCGPPRGYRGTWRQGYPDLDFRADAADGLHF